MRAILGAVLKEGKVNVVALIVLALLVWFAGEVPQLAAVKKFRVLIVLLLLAAWLALYIFQRVMAVRSAMMIEKRLRAQAQEQVAGARPDKKPEVQALERQLDEAIQALKTSRLGTRALYALPWYMIIGPPGSGKSTALQESGLNFPYMSQGRKGIRGVGGTRNCDWWFTDEGILLDTAGRYTTELEDRDEWLAFLDMLKRCRKRTPINGAIVAISVPDLLNATDEQVEAHAKNVRDRLDELVKRLELVFPVYLLFTKCDLLRGFVEFFEDFGKSDRAQVWGCTFPLALAPGQSHAALFDEESRRLYAGLCARRLGPLSAERPADKKQAIYHFPLQFAMAQKRMADFVGALFRPNPYQESAVFRGFYFSSGTQEGAPIDQLVAAMGEAFGLREEAGSLLRQDVERKSYFINHLFTRIIFPDSNLARSSTRVAKRRRILQLGTAAGSAALGLVLLIGLVVSFFGNRSLLASVREAGKEALPVELPSRAEGLPAALQALEKLRVEVARLDEYDRGSRPLRLRWGLYAGNDVNEKARALYFRKLEAFFVAPCGRRLGQDMRALMEQSGKSQAQFQELMDMLLVYRVLGGDLKTEGAPQFILDRMVRLLRDSRRWTTGLPGEPELGSEPRRLADAQFTFFAAQVGQPQVCRIALDTPLVSQVVDALNQGFLVFQEYSAFRDRMAKELKQVGADAILGPSDARAYFKVGYAFSEFFSQRRGWNESARIAFGEMARKIAEEMTRTGIPKSSSDILEFLTNYYATEYTTHWDDLLKSTGLTDFPDLDAAHRAVRALRAEPSPYHDLFGRFREGSTLAISETDVRNRPRGDLKPALTAAVEALKDVEGALYEILSKTRPGERLAWSLQEGKIKGMIDVLSTAWKSVGTAMAGVEPPSFRDQAVAILRQPIQRTFKALGREVRAEITAMWKAQVLSLWEKARGRFPFQEDGTEEVAMAVFADLFKPGTGRIRKLVRDLEPLQRFSFENEPLLSYTTEFTEARRMADRFSDALFEKETEAFGSKASVTLRHGGDAVVSQVILKVGANSLDSLKTVTGRGQLKWAQGPPWGAQLSIRFSDKDQWHYHNKWAEQQWGFLRLIREGEPKPSAEKPGALSISWNLGEKFVSGKSVTLLVPAELEPEGEDHPYLARFFSRFTCPEKICPE